MTNFATKFNNIDKEIGIYRYEKDLNMYSISVINDRCLCDWSRQ